MMLIENVPHRVFVLDTEFLGDIRTPHTCRLWDICIVMMGDSGVEVFQALVDPFPGEEVRIQAPPGYFTPDRQFLDKHGARPLAKVLRAMVRWVRSRCKRHLPVFAAHGAYRADKVVMELDAARVGFRLPMEWHWFDTLYLARDTFPHMKDYTLSTLVTTFVQDNYVQSHRAKDDAVALTALVQTCMPIKGPIYKTYQLPLRSIKGLGGTSEKKLRGAGVLTGDVLKNCIAHIRKVNPTDPMAALRWLARIVGSTNANNIIMSIC